MIAMMLDSQHKENGTSIACERPRRLRDEIWNSVAFGRSRKCHSGLVSDQPSGVLRLTPALLGGLLALASCSSEPPQPARSAAPAEPRAVKITQFYPAAPIVAPGANVTICYGVENASTVSVDPPVEELTPSFNRCFQAPVPRERTFTLKARGPRGDEV